MTARVAIIGGGMAGLAAARRLRAAGIEPIVFDKSRGLGGRMATRRVDDLQFDHGAVFHGTGTPVSGPGRGMVRRWKGRRVA